MGTAERQNSREKMPRRQTSPGLVVFASWVDLDERVFRRLRTTECKESLQERKTMT